MTNLPGAAYGVVIPEPYRTSDRLAQIMRQMSEAGMGASFVRRLQSIAADIRHMEDQMARFMDDRDAEAEALACELVRPGSNVVMADDFRKGGR